MLLWQVGRKPMTLHVSSKLFVVVLIVAALVTAFRTPVKPIDIRVLPEVTLARKVDVTLEPLVWVAPPKRLELPVASVEIVPVPEPVAEVPDVTVSSSGLPIYTLKSTAYNSDVDQTDSTPHITATGATTAFGVIAVSQDMLASIPYGSLVRLKDLGGYSSGRGVGKFQEVLNTQDLFIVEDTMHPRKVEQIDVWFPYESEAMSWGVRKVELEVVRVGRDGPMLEGTIVATQ